MFSSLGEKTLMFFVGLSHSERFARLRFGAEAFSVLIPQFGEFFLCSRRILFRFLLTYGRLFSNPESHANNLFLAGAERRD